MAENRNNNPKYYVLDYTHEELVNILDRIDDFEGGVSEERVLELLEQAQLDGVDTTRFATKELVEQLIGEIELKEGPQGPKGEQGAAGIDGKDGKDFTFDMFTDEQLELLVGQPGQDGKDGKDGKDGTFNPNAIFEELLTSEKTIVGAINEIFQLLKGIEPEEPPVESKLANVFYGYFPYTINQNLMSYADIELDYLQHEDAVIDEAEGVMGKTSIGLVPEACFIVIAIKKELGLVAKKDDGIGGLVDFDESVVGANGLEVEFENEKYLLFGEYTIIDGERFIYVIEK
jgi:hypothetical protein